MMTGAAEALRSQRGAYVNIEHLVAAFRFSLFYHANATN